MGQARVCRHTSLLEKNIYKNLEVCWDCRECFKNKVCVYIQIDRIPSHQLQCLVILYPHTKMNKKRRFCKKTYIWCVVFFFQLRLLKPIMLAYLIPKTTTLNFPCENDIPDIRTALVTELLEAVRLTLPVITLMGEWSDRTWTMDWYPRWTQEPVINGVNSGY